MTKYRIFKHIGFDKKGKKIWLYVDAEADTVEESKTLKETFQQSDPEGTYGILPVPDDIDQQMKKEN